LLKVFIGADPRQPLGYNVLQHSIHQHASKTVAVSPLILRQLPMTRRGLTEFTYSRFLVPYLCGFEGTAVFMDADMVVTGDIAELFAQADPECSVQVMQEQMRFEWSSVMLFNCNACKMLTPKYIDDENNILMDLSWAYKVGEFSADWNHCVGYDAPREAKLHHYTQGLPCWFETKGLPEDAHWHAAAKDMQRTCSWSELMADSIHAKPVMKRLLKRYGYEVRLD